MRKKLIELIQKGANGHTFMPTERIADFLIANGVTVQQWVSVMERLPKKSGLYLVRRKDSLSKFTGLGFFEHSDVVLPYGNKFHFPGGFLDDPFFHRSVTHWMPLPEPPKEV